MNLFIIVLCIIVVENGLRMRNYTSIIRSIAGLFSNTMTQPIAWRVCCASIFRFIAWLRRQKNQVSVIQIYIIWAARYTAAVIGHIHLQCVQHTAHMYRLPPFHAAATSSNFQYHENINNTNWYCIKLMTQQSPAVRKIGMPSIDDVNAQESHR